ncbi:thioredoxin family protein [Amycolatopsis mongoliensis]|uniref:Thioredoxin family protein n=1 Tax=Amycolatopsis mongoliensis TaxID=715475 RepID=A0A9Y2JJ16_9PSEU|nr:thioredoxin family protein [Amycolatopsis sp. 4-36]WIX98196.1 thioredoxin family protein [Amycolatopsis sp. 4-36]
MADEVSGIVALDVAKFNEITKSEDVIVIHLSADWCSPCKAFKAVFRATAESHDDDVVFASLDTDSQPELGAAFNVKSIPTIAVMRGGALIFTHEGSLSENALNDVIRQAREIDIDAVRKSVAARAAK